MLILNPLKPFYIDKKNKIIRMGNFKNAAKEIEYEDESFVQLFEYVKTPITKTELITKLTKNFDLKEEEISDAIDYLISEKIIINYEDYENLLQNKYNRQNLFFSMTSDDIKNWNLENQPNILILGLGGVGSNVAVVLSRTGFKKFTIVDCDKVEESNLIRQYPYASKDIGNYKTDVLKKKIKNEEKEIKTLNRKVNKSEDIEEEIASCDFVLCTLDKPSRIIRRLINDLCVKYDKPVMFSGFSEHVAMIGPFIVPRKSACLKCMLKDMEEEPLNNVITTPSYGPLCLLISSIVASEIINYYYKFNKNNLIGKTLMINILTYEQEIIKWERKEDCGVCGNDSK